MIEYLGKIETEFENTDASLSGAWMGLNHRKQWGSKISLRAKMNLFNTEKPNIDISCWGGQKKGLNTVYNSCEKEIFFCYFNKWNNNNYTKALINNI